MQFDVVSPDQFRMVAWKNGKGKTRELMCEPHGCDDFDWRLSMAPVNSNGAFSNFTNYHRTLILVDGNGLTLNHSSGQRDELSRRFDMAQFDGAWKTDAKLHNGDILDFNVMARQGRCCALVTVLKDKKQHKLQVEADQLLVYSLDGDIAISSPDGRSTKLPATHLLRANSAITGEWTVLGADAICVQIQYLVQR
jgi:environmental stress-induced protein Ves